MTLDARILAILAEERVQMTGHELNQRLRAPRTTLAAALTRLHKTGVLVCLGRKLSADYTGRMRRVNVYAMPDSDAWRGVWDAMHLPHPVHLDVSQVSA